MDVDTPSLPKSCDIVVIGGGIIGLSTALFLAKAGKKVIVLEKGHFGGEQSSRNWGWIRTLYSDFCEFPLRNRSKDLLAELTKSYPEINYHERGLLYAALDDKTLALYENWQKESQQYGVSACMLNPQEVHEKLPTSSRKWKGAIWGPRDGTAEPEKVVAAVVDILRKASVGLYENVAVRGLLRQAGMLKGVMTEQGEVQAEQVICCGGAWSRMFCTNEDVIFPQSKVRATVSLLKPIKNGPTFAINGGDFTCRPHISGGYVLSQANSSVIDLTPDTFKVMKDFFPSWRKNHKLFNIRFGKPFFDSLITPVHFSKDKPTPYEKNRTWDPTPTQKTVTSTLDIIKHTFPEFAHAEIARAWAGMIDVTPDALPVMSSVPKLSGFYLGTGFSAHGFGMGLGSGEFLADLLLDNPNRDKSLEKSFTVTRLSQHV